MRREWVGGEVLIGSYSFFSLVLRCGSGEGEWVSRGVSFCEAL